MTAPLGAEEGSTTEYQSDSFVEQSPSADNVFVWAVSLSSLVLAVVRSWRFPAGRDEVPVAVAAHGPGRG